MFEITMPAQHGQKVAAVVFTRNCTALPSDGTGDPLAARTPHLLA